ncbi:TPA: hypothetical protein ACGSMR_003298 [Escherichia coli]|nr:hypothetical protein [Escherichia coli]
MVIQALQFKLAVAEMLHDAEMWSAANKALYVLLTAKEIKE